MQILFFVRFVLFDSLKVSDSHLIHDSLKWILRYAQYDDKIKLQIRATNRNSQNLRERQLEATIEVVAVWLL